MLFCLADHFEPNHGQVTESHAEGRVRKWMEMYPAMADKFRDSDGFPPRHTWFFGSHHDNRFLSDLSVLAFHGYGEIEYHLHHERDTEESLRDRIREDTKEFSRYGCLLTTGSSPAIRYAFIHGNWALANSDGGRHCGVNGELRILEETGCFADFTMPSFGRPQSRKVNAIYYPETSGNSPRGHDRGRNLEAGRKSGNGLICMQGPLGIFFRGWRPRIENASVTVEEPAVPDRIDGWINSRIGVRGRPEWIFVKVHTHGGIERDWDALFGETAEMMHSYLATKFNDGERYQLHYVTAREMFNIARAAEFGMKGNPNEYRNFEISPYANSRILTNQRYILNTFTESMLDVTIFETPSNKVEMHFNQGIIESVSGNFKRLRILKNIDDSLSVYAAKEEMGNISIKASHRLDWREDIFGYPN